MNAIADALSRPKVGSISAACIDMDYSAMANDQLVSDIQAYHTAIMICC